MRRVPVLALFVGLALALTTAIGLSLALGAVDISLIQVVGILLDHIGIDNGIEFSSIQDVVLWSIRLPRVALGIVVGGSLGVAGVA